MLSREERMQKKIEKLQLKQAKIQEKIDKKYKNYQERDDKEQQLWLREHVKSDDAEQFRVQNGADFLSDKKLAKNNKKILKNQQKELRGLDFSQDFGPQQQDYFDDFDIGFEPNYSPKTPLQTPEKPALNQKTEFASYANEPKMEQSAARDEIYIEPKVSAPQQETAFISTEPQITEEKQIFTHQTEPKIAEKEDAILEPSPKTQAVDHEHVDEPKQQPVTPSFTYYEDLSIEPKQQQTEQKTEYVAPKSTVDNYTSKEDVDLKKENKELKEKNAKLAAQNEALNKENRGFQYAEVMTNKKESKKDQEIAQLKEEKEAQSAKQKQIDLEESRRQDKINDIVRQRKDMNYTIERLEDKVPDWYEISDHAYMVAMDCYFSGTMFRGINLSNYWMGKSMIARAFAQGYQRDLQSEREKMLEKERQLQRLCQ